jgi:hypothetical protein
VIFGREGIPDDVDRLDQRLGRQRRAREAVDADDRIPAGEILELQRHLGGIIRQVLDLLSSEHGLERTAAWVSGGGLRVLTHGHRFLDPFQGQDDDMAIVSAMDADLGQHAELEPREFRLDAVPPRQEPLEGRDAFVGRGHRRKRGRLVRRRRGR